MNRYREDGTNAQFEENADNDGFPATPAIIYNLRREDHGVFANVL